MKKNIIVGQSDGPTTMINASLYGVACEGLKQEGSISHVHGMIHGIEEFLKDMRMDVGEGLSEKELEPAKLTPAVYLSSCRFKLPEDLTSPVYATLSEKLEALNIGYFFYIGGDSSMDTMSKLSRYAAGHKSSIRFVGIPKTTNSDLIHMDHTPGYENAAKYVASTVQEIVLDPSVYQQSTITIMELMGRNARWLTAASILARKKELDNLMLIYLLEADSDFKKSTRDSKAILARSSSVIICVSEGISDFSGRLICEYVDEARVDNFGHKVLAGYGEVLENFVRSRFGIKIRSVEPNVSQCHSGTAAASRDVEEAATTGAYGVQAALNSATGMMVVFERQPGGGYEIRYTLVDVDEVCNREKSFPKEWVTRHRVGVSEESLSYTRPPIQGEVSKPMEDGLPPCCFRCQVA